MSDYGKNSQKYSKNGQHPKAIKKSNFGLCLVYAQI